MNNNRKTWTGYPALLTLDQIFKLHQMGVIDASSQSSAELHLWGADFLMRCGLMEFQKEEDHFDLELVDFDQEDAQPFLIDNVLYNRQPVLVAGRQKTLKTSGVMDLLLSLATGTPFLNHFPVNEQRRCLLISKESGKEKLINTRHRILVSRGLNDANDFLLCTQGDFTIDRRSPIRFFQKWIEDQGVEVVAIDPAYLILDTSGKESSMFGMGPLLNVFTEMCGDALPIVVHHTNDRLSLKTVPQLHHAAFSGFQQYARQWILLNRRSDFTSPRNHQLIANIGGSQGHSGIYNVNIDEGEFQEGQLTHWNVGVSEYESPTAQLNKVVEDQNVRKLVQHVQEHPDVTVKIRRSTLGLNGSTYPRYRDQAIERGYLANGKGKLSVTSEGVSFLQNGRGHVDRP